MSSFYDKSSLVLIPSGTNTGKVFSQKPVSGDGDFTFTRASAATRVNADGNIEKETENLLKYSNDFSNAVWSKFSNTTYTLTTETITDPFGVSNSVYKVTLTGSGYVTFRQNLSGNTRYMTASAYIKKSSAGLSVSVDQSDGGIENAASNTDWQRLSAPHASGYTFSFIDIAITGVIGDYFYVSSAQMELGGAARDYIETTTTAVYGGITDNTPRLDYTDSSCPALLLEPLRTNIVTQSEYFGGYSNSNSTDEANSTTSPEGLTNATSFLEAATTGQHKLVTSVTFDGSNDYTFSIFAKSNGRDLYVDTQNSNEWGGRAWFDLTAGTANAVLGTADIEDFGNGWYRCIVTGASTLAGGNLVELLTSDGSTNSTTGDITKGVFIYGAQVEAGSYPTSYIPTYGSSVSRVAEVCGDAGTSTTFNSTEGVLYAEIAALADDLTYREISISDGSNNNRIELRYSNSTNRVQALLRLSGGNVLVLTATNVDITSFNKVAFKYKQDDFSLWINSVEIGTLSSGNVFPVNTLTELSFDGGYNEFFYGKTNQLLYFPTALSDADLEILTGTYYESYSAMAAALNYTVYE